MKALLLACLIFASPMAAAAEPPQRSCGTFSPTDAVSAPLTIKEIEREEMVNMSASLKIRPDLPRVPFGFMNPEWRVFKAMVRPRDKIVKFTSSRHSWEHRAGRAGIALVRAGCVIHEMTTMMS